jgi:hypothetical protein
VKFCRNSPQKGGLFHQKGGRSEGKRGSHQMYDTKGPYRVFLWYRLGKYQENTSRYHTKIPNRDTTLDWIVFNDSLPKTTVQGGSAGLRWKCGYSLVQV